MRSEGQHQKVIRFYYSLLTDSCNRYNKLNGFFYQCLSCWCFSDGDGKAFLQKERLLRFDRDFARRTEVFDDQADYQAPSTWMTEEEEKEAEENKLKHLESLKRPKQTLKLAI
jgi:hypothetical protein